MAEKAENGPNLGHWMPIRCPHCQSTHQRHYKTKGSFHYHHCQDCGERFKSLEVEPEAEGDG